MRKVLLRGPLLTASGYGEHARQFFRWLETRDDIEFKVQCLNWGTTTWYLDRDLEEGLIGRIMAKTDVNENDKFDISIQVQLPDEWDPKLAMYNIGVSAFLETNRCSYEWAQCCNKMNRVIVPSDHALKGIEAYGQQSTKIDVVNECYNPLINSPDYSFDLKLKTDFNFLIVSQLTGNTRESDRKNILNTIESFCESFKDNRDVGLVIKTNLGRSTLDDRKNTEMLMSSITKRVKKSEFPRIYMLHGLLTPEEMGAVYRDKKIKCLVSLTRGEGYGLPLLEASVCGLPVIATNWSGHLDFLKSFVKIDYDLKQIPDERVDGRIFQKGMLWANPSLDDFKRKVVEFKDNPGKAKKEAKKQSKVNSSKFSQLAFNREMNEVLK